MFFRTAVVAFLSLAYVSASSCGPNACIGFAFTGGFRCNLETGKCGSGLFGLVPTDVDCAC
ncbi:hypothetical protein Pmar_PMAR020033 [Perkinsus marinus ATCC 50983]|uniref:Uncharacterized protein n=1 Tax=Perkinsus marinus (strain ATCC 50983 / TXsc) TaxID=423536 RepID=C5L0J1_PERM5|nr:hypothetical protein Pmar_PMAR020033 [Perkinsus marinus ATCC 50983]EER09739.1 hypothetical protein Pmar_PMAR020033 [Perkinsus marinus ATCC 50983]|eukprot:XP_002777944.1 hypothetical protein Pmar_PMAR020033 [Perkinsus marinus ATCC 50983]